jgi:hypothetical protein
MTGDKDSDWRAETAGIRKKVGLILERQGCQRFSGKA